MKIGDLVLSDRFKSYIGIVRKVDPDCQSQLTVFIQWLQSGLVSWEDPNHLEVLCK